MSSGIGSAGFAQYLSGSASNISYNGRVTMDALRVRAPPGSYVFQVSATVAATQQSFSGVKAGAYFVLEVRSQPSCSACARTTACCVMC